MKLDVKRRLRSCVPGVEADLAEPGLLVQAAGQGRCQAVQVEEIEHFGRS